MKNKYEQLAKDIYKWCKENDLWGDNCIYFNGKAWASWKSWHGVDGKEIDENLYEYENRNPKDYFEYANPDTLSMSFEGPLYYVINGHVPGWIKKEKQLAEIIEKYGLYYELGHAWNFSTFEI